MGLHHGNHSHTHHDPALEAAGAGEVPVGYKAALVVALVLNAAMAAIEIASGLSSQSVALLADAIDFLGDSGNYALSLAVLAWHPVWRSRAAVLKAVCMAGFGLLVLGRVAWATYAGTTPQPITMGLVGALALIVNLGVAALLYRFRTGDANMRSAWLCSRNDALGNVAVIVAALGVFGSGGAWPDWIVAAFMAGLALHAAAQVLAHAAKGLRSHRPSG